MTGGFCRGDFVTGGFCLGDFCPGGYFPGGFLWLDFFPGGFYPGTMNNVYNSIHFMQFINFRLHNINLAYI